MNSNWLKEIRFVMRKEWISESRSKSGWITAALLGVCTVFSVAFAAAGRSMPGELGAGMLWATLLFVAIGTLGRSYILEEEQGTSDLLRLIAHPVSVYWGKAIFAWAQMTIAAVVLSFLFVLLTGLHVERYDFFVYGLIGGAASLASTVTFCSALIARGANRGSMVGVISFPLMTPVVALGVVSGRVAMGVGSADSGLQSTAGLWLYAVMGFVLAPQLAAYVWKEG